MDGPRYLLYRCDGCKSLITKLEIMATRSAALEVPENNEGVRCVSAAICPCGSAKFHPTNILPEEEDTLCSKWQGFRYFVLFRRDRGTRLWDLWWKCVRTKKYDTSVYVDEK